MAKRFSLRDRIRSFRYAYKGLYTLTKEEHNFRIHLVACVVVIVSGLLLKVSATDWRWLVLCMGLGLMAEAFNTAIEYLVNMVQPEHHPLAGKIKDVAAAAMLVIALTTLVLGLLIFLPYLKDLLE